MRHMSLRVFDETTFFLGRIVIIPIAFYGIRGALVFFIHRHGKGNMGETSDGWRYMGGEPHDVLLTRMRLSKPMRVFPRNFQP